VNVLQYGHGVYLADSASADAEEQAAREFAYLSSGTELAARCSHAKASSFMEDAGS
jgi:hypothetical protein